MKCIGYMHQRKVSKASQQTQSPAIYSIASLYNKQIILIKSLIAEADFYEDVNSCKLLIQFS